MAFDQLLIRPQKVSLRGAGAGVGLSLSDFVFDASIRERHGIDFRITEEPIEDGRQVAENMVQEPRSVDLEVVLTRDPDIIAASLRNPDRVRHINAWQDLIALAKAEELLEGTTSLERYKNVVIQSVSTVRTSANARALVCSVTLREIEIETVESVDNIRDDLQDFAEPAEDIGPQASEQVIGLTPEEEILLGL